MLFKINSGKRLQPGLELTATFDCRHESDSLTGFLVNVRIAAFLSTKILPFFI